MVVSIHQPNYLPWLGFFYKIYASDIFIYHDDVEHSKKSLTRRCLIRKEINSSDSRYLTIPLEKQSDFCLIKDLLISHKSEWAKKQMRQIQLIYGTAPFYKEVVKWLFPILEQSKDKTHLADLNIMLIETMLDQLGISSKRYRSSDFDLAGKNDTYNIALVKHFKGETYLSGTGAKKYQDESLFKKENIQLQYHQIFPFLNRTPYVQYQGSFLNGLSALDAFFNIGSKSIISYFDQYHKIRVG